MVPTPAVQHRLPAAWGAPAGLRSTATISEAAQLEEGLIELIDLFETLFKGANGARWVSRNGGMTHRL